MSITTSSNASRAPNIDGAVASSGRDATSNTGTIGQAPPANRGSEATKAAPASKSRNSNKDISQESDSFYKHYNKDIRISQEEIPIVVYELMDAAYNYIKRESYEKALILLQKTEGVLEVVSLDFSKRDRYLAFTTFHNMAMCYQKLGMLEECYIYLKECLSILTAPMPKGQYFYKCSPENCIAARMKQLKQECKIKLQLCAILSQTQNHMEALDNAKKSCKLVHQLFKDLLMLSALYIKKIEDKEVGFKVKKAQNEDVIGSKSVDEGSSDGVNFLKVQQEHIEEEPRNFLEESISLLERTSMKLYPIVKEVIKRMIPEKKNQKAENLSLLDVELEKLLSCDDVQNFILPQQAADMRSVLGYLNQNEWVYQLNIGNIMQLQPISIRQDLLSHCRNECELSREAFLEKISFMSVAYFCVSTETRFIMQSREQYITSPVKKHRLLESEYWHAKSLEIACTFLPSECPLLNHILISYQKHHDPSHHPIKEDLEQTDVLNVIRPLPGIESNKHQPIVRQITSIKVAITPCQISPIGKRIFQMQNAPSQKQVAYPSGSAKEESMIVMYDQQQEVKQINQQLQTSIENLHDHLLPAANSKQLSQQQVSLYSDDFYDRFVKKIFDENPQLDRKQLVSRLLSHLQSQNNDYSILQRHINEQDFDEVEDLSEGGPGLVNGFSPGASEGESSIKRRQRKVEKEQRRTLMHFGQEQNEDSIDSPIDVNDIMVLRDSPFLQREIDGDTEEFQDLSAHLKQLKSVAVTKSTTSNKQGLSMQNSQKNHNLISTSALPRASEGPSGHSSAGAQNSGKNSKKGQSGKESRGSNQPLQSHGNTLKENQSKKKRGVAEGSTRVQKFMSYLEGGDSLLKEIEKSLENHQRQQQFEDDDELGYEEDQVSSMILPVHKTPLQEEVLAVQNLEKFEDVKGSGESSQVGCTPPEKGGGKFANKKLFPLDIDSDDNNVLLDDEPEKFERKEKVKERPKPPGEKSKKSEVKRVSQAGLKGSGKSKGASSLTRPSSSITNQNSVNGTVVGLGRRTSHSLLMSKKHPGRQSALHQQFQSQQHQLQGRNHSTSDDSNGPLSPNESSASLRAHSEGRQIATSINVNPTNFSAGGASKKGRANGNKEKVQGKNLSRVLTTAGQGGCNTTGMGTFSKLKGVRPASNTSKKYRYGTQPSQQVNGSRTGCLNGAPRSKSRLSNQSQKHLKSDQQPIPSTKNGIRKSQEKKRTGAKSKSSEGEQGRSSSTTKNRAGRDPSSESIQGPQFSRNQESSATPGGGATHTRLSVVPLLTQPSFTDNISSNLNHNQSFDVSFLKKPSRLQNQSIISLQQQVLLNQKLLKQFEQQRNSASLIQNSRKSNSRPSTALSKQPLDINGVQRQCQVDQSKKSQSRSKSITGLKKQLAGVVSESDTHNFSRQFVAGSNNLPWNSNFVMQQANSAHNSSFQGTGNKRHVSSFFEAIGAQNQSTVLNTSNKENFQLMQKAATNLLGQARNKSTLQNSSAGKKKLGGKEFANSILSTQKQLSRDMNALKMNSKGRAAAVACDRSFFDANSPQLQRKKKKGNGTGSNSPPKKLQMPGCSQPKLSQKATNQLKNMIININSRQAIAANLGTQSKTGFNTEGGGRQRAQTAGKKRKQLHQSFMQLTQEDDIQQQQQQQQLQSHTNSWWLLPENNQSFDAILKGSIGSGPQQILLSSVNEDGTVVKRPSSKHGTESIGRLNFEMLNRGSQDSGTIHASKQSQGSISTVAAAALLQHMRNNRNGSHMASQSLQGNLGVQMYHTQQSVQAHKPQSSLPLSLQHQVNQASRMPQSKKPLHNIRA